MKIYEITIGTGTAWLNVQKIIVEDYQCEQDALDIMIDRFEENKDVHLLTQEEIDIGEYFPDEYITGGNHGKCLVHFGSFNIKELEDFSTLHKYVLTNSLSFSGYEEDEHYSSHFCNLFANDIKNIYEVDKIINKEIGQVDLREYLETDFRNKIFSIVPQVEFNKEGELIGKTTILTTEELSNEEMDLVKTYCVGQFSDGWGESFEQQEIKLKGEDFVSICVSFWTWNTSYSISKEN